MTVRELYPKMTALAVRIFPIGSSLLNALANNGGGQVEFSPFVLRGFQIKATSDPPNPF
ncbi:MAG: hypothetical protein ABSH13_25140 [Candidatus Acidiferrum sp.]